MFLCGYKYEMYVSVTTTILMLIETLTKCVSEFHYCDIIFFLVIATVYFFSQNYLKESTH